MSAEGIEYHPPVGTLSKTKILQTEDFVSAEGIEPSTNGLKGRCSAIELRARRSRSGLHSNMGNIHRQRKTFALQCVHHAGGKNGRCITCR